MFKDVLVNLLQCITWIFCIIGFSEELISCSFLPHSSQLDWKLFDYFSSVPFYRDVLFRTVLPLILIYFDLLRLIHELVSRVLSLDKWLNLADLSNQRIKFLSFADARRLLITFRYFYWGNIQAPTQNYVFSVIFVCPIKQAWGWDFNSISIFWSQDHIYTQKNFPYSESREILVAFHRVVFVFIACLWFSIIFPCYCCYFLWEEASEILP